MKWVHFAKVLIRKVFCKQFVMVSCSRFIWITNPSDHRRVWTENLLHTNSVPNPLGHKAWWWLVMVGLGQKASLERFQLWLMVFFLTELRFRSKNKTISRDLNHYYKTKRGKHNFSDISRHIISELFNILV